jgi:hypothetical protein
MSKQEVKTVGETANLPVEGAINLPATLDFAGDFGSGFEEADASCYTIPFLKQLQATSDQTQRQNAEYIKGAESGDFLNTVTERLYKADVGVHIIPCYFIHKYNEWVPNRGGFKGSHSIAEYTEMQKVMKLDAKGNPFEARADNGNQLTDAREHYVMIIEEDGTTTPAVLSFDGSQLKKSRKWMTLMQGIKIGNNTAPMFSQTYRITAVPESNDQGNWYGVKIEHAGQITNAEMYQQAKAFRDLIKAGSVKLAMPEDDQTM